VPLSSLNSKKKKSHLSKEESYDSDNTNRENNLSPESYDSDNINRENNLSPGSYDSDTNRENNLSYMEVTTPEPHAIKLDNNNDKSIFNAFKNTLPTVYSVIIRMPGNLLPFTLGMFILVEALSTLGWISIFASAISVLTPSYPVAVISIAIISIILCNLLNNLPMTVLLSRILQNENFTNAPHIIQDPAIKQGCIYALIIGSNIGACLTIVGALAGLMWDKILKDKNEKIGYWQFVKWNLGVLPVVAIGACGVLIIELW
ncbi:12517_t:CDS:2, partial [Dentiscutata heterogama]